MIHTGGVLSEEGEAVTQSERLHASVARQDEQFGEGGLSMTTLELNAQWWEWWGRRSIAGNDGISKVSGGRGQHRVQA